MSKIDLSKPPYVFWVTVAIILFVGFVISNAFTGELSKYTDEERQNLEWRGFDLDDPETVWMIVVFIVIMAAVIFLSTPYGRFLTEMAMYDQR